MENRKIQLSKKLLKESFIELLEEIPLNKISVKLLCEKANLNRSTFYSHYEDINYLIDDIENDVIKQMPYMSYNTNNSEEQILELSKVIEKNYKAIVLLTKNGKLIDHFVEQSVKRYIEIEGEKSEEEIEVFTFMSYYCIGGLFHAQAYWVNSNGKLSIKQTSQILYSLALEATKIRYRYNKN